MRLTAATVIEATEPLHAVQRLVCECADGQRVAALNYLELGALLAVGEPVTLNVTALDLQLGTGGVAFVVPQSSPETYSQPGRAAASSPADSASPSEPASPSAPAGHIIKLRYTPLQRDVLTVEEQSSPHHSVMQQACSLEGVPVVCCNLHSQLPLVAAAARQCVPAASIAYCMTDQAALPLAFSQIAASARDTGLINATITCGQALGGDLEAVNLHSGLLAARHVLKADIIIVALGPGIVGTDTPFGHGGIAQAEALNAAAALDGVPIATLRLSFADKRPRHQGLSHHSTSALGRACLAQAILAMPASLPSVQHDAIMLTLEEQGLLDRHGLVEVPSPPAAPDLRGVQVTSMGRSQQDDPAFFAAAFAAGYLAARFHAERHDR